MRASRLVQLLLLLQANGRMTAAQLAGRLEVSVRTIYRDLEALGAAGVPVYAEPGPGGGCQLVDGYRTRLTGLTADEAQVMALTGLPDAAAELGLGTVLAAAQIKVEAALPPELRSRAVRMRQRFHLDAPGWFKRREEVPFLPLLSQGVWEERLADITYRRWDADRGELRESTRTLEPLGLVLKAGTWYLVAGVSGSAPDGSDPDLRTYRVSRVCAASLRDEHFDRPEDFDLGLHWAESQEAFAGRPLAHEVVARVRAEALEPLRWSLDPASGERALQSASAPDEHGWVRVTVPTEHPEHALRSLLALGGSAEVVEPAWLRQRAAAEVLSALERYEAPPLPA
ncbi:MAG: helix-turn-helix transcriptional regulator [Acidimicrobiia bacterium]